jgi:hypothetical protein
MYTYGKAAICAVVLIVMASAPGAAEDRHAGYYYPDPQSREVYSARAKTLPEASRKARIAFVTGVTSQMLRNPYPPEFAIFAKGEEGEKMIIVSLKGDTFNTLYRMRGLLATLTAVARTTKMFQESAVEDYFTFFDLAKMLGFELITVSDGRDFAHQIVIE